jgi:hypothetical protein
MEWKIDLSDLKESAVRRMLRDAITTEHERSLPMHRRGKKQLEVEAEDEATEDADDENQKLVELAEENGKPADIPMTNEDVSEEAGDKLAPPKKPAAKKVAGKLGKPYTPS